MRKEEILILNRKDLVPTPQPIALIDLKPFHFKSECYHKIRTVPITLFECEDGTYKVLTSRLFLRNPSTHQKL